jgi:hypothetical protein
MTTVVVQRILGRMAIIDQGNARVYPVGGGFVMPESGKHRAEYTFAQAQEVSDWVNGIDQPLNIVARSVDPFDPVRRCTGPHGIRKGLTPIRD